ncbi:MAG: heme biosynthesis HemY N-terminal domain-containing protein [Hyphomonadaceae bacterium]|nr:heme biosynthesis HemY N-terminal domain-containing protein [Hyphomonadaceae bacterium]
MLRLAFLLIVAVFAALAAMQASQDPGTVRIEWGGYRVDTTALFGALAVILLIAIALPVLRLLMMLLDAPGRLGKVGDRARIRRGQEAIALGLIAAEAGEFEAARKHADKASTLIDEPRLANLLAARAAEVAGDTAAAERAYSGMLSHEDTELLGRKGLLAAALKRGDRITAMAHAEAALKAAKNAAWPFQTLFELKVQAADWEGAIDALEEGEKRRLIDDRVAKRRRAVLLCAAAMRAERERRPEKCVDLAQKAVRVSPGFAPAAALAAKYLVAEGKAERAASIIEEAWDAAPHPVLAHAYRDLKPGETREERAARLAALADRRRDHRESKIILAALALGKNDFGAAQAALDDCYREFPSARIAALYAELARAKGDENAARTWLSTAAAAPREPDWSDLDPDGNAFLYDDTDWARLVYVYGDGGQLIHPRQDRVLEPGAAPRALPASPGEAAASAA